MDATVFVFSIDDLCSSCQSHVCDAQISLSRRVPHELIIRGSCKVEGDYVVPWCTFEQYRHPLRSLFAFYCAQ